LLLFQQRLCIFVLPEHQALVEKFCVVQLLLVILARDGWSGNFATVSGITLCGSFTVQTWNYLDSPATTSATTYKMQGRLETTASGSTSEWQPGSKPSTITLIEIGA
jgi:hypothetical protein